MPIMKIGLDQLDPFVFNTIRLCISAICLAALAFRERNNGIFPAPDICGRQIVTYGILVSWFYQVLFLMGIARTTVGNTGLIMATVPVWTALLARVFISETLSRLAWGGLTLALSGTVIVALQQSDLSSGNEHMIGNILILFAALAWASGTVYSRPLLKSISPMQLSAAAALLALPMLLYAGVLSSGLSLPMWNFGVRHAGAAHAAVVQNLIPLIAIVAAWFSRGEVATTTQILGGSLILSGLVIMRLRRNSQKEKVPKESVAAVTDG
jgi:drug/metabolite transporter (DMT)-like permease